MLSIIKNESFYLYLIVKYFTPLFLLSFLFYSKLIFKNINFIFASILFAIIGFFIIDPLATYWNAWGFNYDKTLNIRICNTSVIEELIWAILLCSFVAIVVSVCINKLENNKPFFIPSFLTNRIKNTKVNNFLRKYF